MTLKAKHKQQKKQNRTLKEKPVGLVFRQSENKVQEQVFGLICKNLG